MRCTQKFLAIPIVMLLAACENSGANYQPIIDGPMGPEYTNDLAHCQNLAAQLGPVDSNTIGNVLATAGIAAATAAVFNDYGNNVRDAAAIGAVAGLTTGAINQNSRKEAIVRNCMVQRGYRVVG